MENNVSVAFNLDAPIQSGPISSYHTVFGHEVKFSHGYPMVYTVMSECDFRKVQNDPEQNKFVRVALKSGGENPVYLKGKSWS